MELVTFAKFLFIPSLCILLAMSGFFIVRAGVGAVIDLVRGYK